MSEFDKKVYWKAERFKYKTKYLKWRWNKDNDVPFQQFLYRSGLQEKIITEFIRTLKNQGYNIDWVIDRWHKKTGILKVDAEKLLKKDTKTLQIWELEHLLKTFDFELSIKYNGARSYSASVEKDRLIIISHQNPHFVLNVNIENYYDFTADFYKKERFMTLSERKVTRFIFEAFRFYFLQEANLDKLPFNERKMKDHIKTKFFKGEMLIKE